MEITQQGIKEAERCAHCGSEIFWQGRYGKNWGCCCRGYWCSTETGSSCPKSIYGHERILRHCEAVSPLPCQHERLDEEGYCRKCGADMRSGVNLGET